MTSTTLPRTTLSGLTFGGVLRSEWIKLRTLRSTVWCCVIIVVLTVGLGALLAATVNTQGALPYARQQSIWLQVSTLGITFAELVSAVLGALVITGEYGTGMIRSTLTAVPTRIPALVAKALVFGATTFVIGLVSIVLAALASTPSLAAHGVHADFASAHTWWIFVGGAGYLAIIGMISLSIGAIIRNSAGGIAASLGLVLVLPTVVGIIAGLTKADWATKVGDYLPSSAGGQMYAAVHAPGADVLEPWQGFVVVVIWLVVLFAVAATLLKRRDA